MLMIIAETAVEKSVDIELAGDVRAWRPKSVHSYPGILKALHHAAIPRRHYDAKLPFAFIEGPLISRSNSIQMKRGIGPLCGVWLARSTSMSSIKHQPIPQEVVAPNNR
jgi:hypothetical protein